MMPGDSTRAVHAGLPEPERGAPYLPGPVFAAPFHLPGEPGPDGYSRYGNPTFGRYEAAIAELEGGGRSLVFSSGMAASTAVLDGLLGPGDVLVAPSDGYFAIRPLAQEHLAPRGVEVRLVATDERAVRDALDGATLVWVETPSNPELRVLDVEALAGEVHAAGARLCVDGTLASPLRQRPLELGADLSLHSGSKVLTGHADLILGVVTARDDSVAERLRSWRTTTGAVPGPFEVWLAHRSLATLAIRIERQEATAALLADALRRRGDVADVRWPGLGCVVAFTLSGEDAADRFLEAAPIVTEATSFGGVHTSAERRARWGTDDIAEGWIRFSCGIEDTEDVVEGVLAALDAVAG